MRAYSKNLYGRNHRYSTPEHVRVPKSAGERIGSRSAVRQVAKGNIRDDIQECDGVMQ